MSGSAGLPGLRGRRAVITGGSRGIGRATVRLLARHGARVGIAYRGDHAAAEEALRRARREAGVEGGAGDGAGEGGREGEGHRDGARFWSHAGDLSREEGVAALFRRVDEEFGGLDVFVGNAGIWNPDPVGIEELPFAEWRRMISVNLDSIHLTTRAAVRRMGAGGRIVLVSSTAGQRGEPGHSHYAASKGAILSFCKSLAGELGPRGITVNAVAPGWVDTEMSASVLRSEARKEILEEIPLRRVAEPEDVAGPIAFLASDLGRHVTGAVLNVNGGSVLCG